jgi:hypothetical protein
MRAERIQRRVRSRRVSQTSRDMDERLRRMNERASALDMRLHRHAEKSASWHAKWDDPPRRLANTHPDTPAHPSA